MTTLSFVLPDQSFLFNTLRRCHYMDSFQEVLLDPSDTVQITDAVQAFFAAVPGGLPSMAGPRKNNTDSMFSACSNTGIQREARVPHDNSLDKLNALPLRLFSQTTNEIVVGMDTRHLNIRISFFLEPQRNFPNRKVFTITTMVQFNNGWGRLFFFPLRLLHTLAFPVLLKNAAGKLANPPLAYQ